MKQNIQVITTDEFKAKALIGAGNLLAALSLIGAHDADDHSITKIVVDAELELRALIDFALAKATELTT